MALLDLDFIEKDSGVSRSAWRNWLHAGQLPFIRIGRKICVAEDDYRAFLEQRRVPKRAEPDETAATETDGDPHKR